MADRHIHTNENRRGDVAIRLSYPTGTAGKPYAVLHVIDEPSRQTLVEVQLTPEMLMDLMGNSTAHATGATLPARPERLGLRSQNTTIPVGRGQDDGVAVLAAVHELTNEGWTVSTRRTNSGTDVVGFRWIDADGNPVPEAA